MRAGLCLALAACGAEPVAPPAAPPPDVQASLPAGHPFQMDLQALPFADVRSRRRFLALVDATAATVPDSWTRRHSQRADGTVSVRWCSPAVPERRCTTGSVVQMDDPGVGWRAVSVFPAAGDTQLAGLGWEAGEHPVDGPWGLAQERVDAPPSSTRPSGWWIGARARTETGPLMVPLADAATWTIDGVRISLPSASPPDWSTDSGLLEAFQAQQDALLAAALTEIDKGIDACAPASTGAPGADSQHCRQQPLDVQRQADLREELRTTFDQRQAAIDAHAATLAALLRQTRAPVWTPPDG